jgi:hypothetical protein
VDGCGYEAVETWEIIVRRTFADFDDLWMINLKSPSLGPTVAAMEFGDVETLKRRVRAHLPADNEGHPMVHVRMR